MRPTSKPRKCSARCQDHVFSIKPITLEASMRHELQIQLCPKHSSQGNVLENPYPEYNNDGKCYTHAFILGVDRKANVDNDLEMQEDHNRRVQEALQPRRQIFLPKPSRKHKVCSVCRCNYDDYLEHIKSKAHKRQITNSKYNSEILKMCWTLFNNDNKVEIVVEEEELLSTTGENRRPQNIDQVEPKPTKRRRYDQERRSLIKPVVEMQPEIMWQREQIIQQIQMQHLLEMYHQPALQQLQQMAAFPQLHPYAMMYPQIPNPFLAMGMPSLGHYFQTGVATNPIVLDQ